MPPGMAILASELYLQLTITSVLYFISLQNDSSHMQKKYVLIYHFSVNYEEM